MKKTMSMLLVFIMIFSVMAYAGVAYAKNNAGNSRPLLLPDDDAFLQLTPQQQYDYLLTLGTEQEIEQFLSLFSSEQLELLLDSFSDEQLAVLKPYLEREDREAPEPSQQETTVPELPNVQQGTAETPPADTPAPEPTNDGEEAPVPTDEATEPVADYNTMTPQELYAYLCTLDDAACEEILALLTPEQSTALEAYILGIDQTAGSPAAAADQTQAAPLKKPVQIALPKAPKKMAAKSADRSAGEPNDALMLDKTVSGENGQYLLTIEAYATGEVSVTTGDTPVPADIILVLDISKSMDSDMSTGAGAYYPVSYTKNSKAYLEQNGLYVKVDNQYYDLTITLHKKTYTYSYTIDTTTYSFPSNGDNTNPPADLAFYRYSQDTIHKIDALIAAANSFIDSIEAKANAGAGVDHRIAVVAYSSDATILSGSSASNAFVSAHSNSAGINTLQNNINDLSTVMWTRADLGLQKAVGIFQQDLPDTGGLRNRVVVFFTDGAPSAGDSGNFQSTVANPAISAAKTLKDPASDGGCGATVYSVGIFNGANPAALLSDASDENKFMHFVSSNYPDAQNMTNYGTGSNAGYYLSASSAGGLSSIFQSISQKIETGGTSVTLDEESAIKDMIAPYFELPAAADEDDILVYISEVNASTGQWQPPQLFDGDVAISEDRRTVSVSGFDYKDNYYVAVKNEQGTIIEYRGKKLIFSIPIAYIPYSCLGGVVPTNLGVSGIYDEGMLIETLPIPHVPIPVDYDYTAVDHSVYLLSTVAIADLFADTQSYYVPNTVNNAFVDIVYTVKNSVNSVLATYTIPRGANHGTWSPADPVLTSLTGNAAYTVSCTITPISSEVAAVSLSKQAHVYVFRPEVTYKDSTIYLGQTADYTDNFVRTEWKNSVAGAPIPSGTAPVLSLLYAPPENAFAADTYVSATLRIGGTDVTEYAVFNHESHPSCVFDPSQGAFIVHVKSCSLTVAKTGAADETDTFVFTVTNDSGLTLLMTVQGNTGQTITGLPVGEYTVTEAPDWSWRYTASPQSVTLSSTNAAAAVTIDNDLTNDKWLGGDSRAANLFNGSW